MAQKYLEELLKNMAVKNTLDEETKPKTIVRIRSVRPDVTHSTAANNFTAITPRHYDVPRAATSAITTPPALDWYEHLATWIDGKSGGRGEELMRILSFLIIGGSASVLNLICVFLFSRILGHHSQNAMGFFITTALATEISLIYNFTLNDRFTFRSMVDARRTWLQRCLRFHAPASIGFTLTLLIGSFAFNVGHLSNITSQAIAITIVTAVNFFMHRYWTFRPSKEAIA